MRGSLQVGVGQTKEAEEKPPFARRRWQQRFLAPLIALVSECFEGILEMRV
jgi:hypothetical protein